jgi:carbon storage regulator CsrA
MLVLARTRDEGITLSVGGETIHVLLVDVRGSTVRIGIDASPACVIARDELIQTRALNQQAAISPLPERTATG